MEIKVVEIIVEINVCKLDLKFFWINIVGLF